MNLNLTLRITGWLRAARLGPPRRRSVPRDRRRFAMHSLVAGIIGLLLLQIGLGVTAENSLYIRDPGYSDKEIRLARLEVRDHAGPRIIMMGTSRTAAAFHAARVRFHIGSGVVFNFGIPASGPVTHSVYLKRLLAAGHKPDFLILEVLAPTLADVHAVENNLPQDYLAPLESRFFFGDRLKHGELDDVIHYGFPAESVHRKWRQSVTIPCYALRFPIMGRVIPSSQSWHIRFDWSRSGDEFGWGAPEVETVPPEQYAAGLVRAKNEYRDILADMNPTGGGSRALADIAALCRKENIPLTMVLMPEASGFRTIYPPAVLQRVHAFLNGVCREHGCKLIDAREWLPDSGFTDGHHMLRSGAFEFTDRLTREAVVPFMEGKR